MGITITQLNFYPVKSCAGTALDTALLTERGIEHDREWLIIDTQTSIALTQRDFTQMCLIKTAVTTSSAERSRGGERRSAGAAYGLSLSAPNMRDINIPVANCGERIVSVWDDECRAEDQGEDAAFWLSRYFEHDCRLVRMAPDFVRTVDQAYAKRKSDQVGFADAFPLLLISQESLEELNTKLAEQLPMNRFRPNIVVKGGEPFAEDTWKTIRVNDLLFDVLKPCDRCLITTIDQSTAHGSVEPLRTLAKFRTVGKKVMFGMNLAHHSTGQLKVGAQVEVLD